MENTFTAIVRYVLIDDSPVLVNAIDAGVGYVTVEALERLPLFHPHFGWPNTAMRQAGSINLCFPGLVKTNVSSPAYREGR